MKHSIRSLSSTKDCIAISRHLCLMSAEDRLYGNENCEYDRSLVVYSYHQFDSTDTSIASITLCSDGKVQFRTDNEIVTPMHGRWVFDERQQRMLIKFSQTGDTADMRSVVLQTTGSYSNILVGWDDQERGVVMRCMSMMRECVVHHCWHWLDPAMMTDRSGL